MAQGACRGHPCLHLCSARKYAFADAAPPARLERDYPKLAAQVRAGTLSQPTSALKARISTINRRIVQSTSRMSRAVSPLVDCRNEFDKARDRIAELAE